MHYAHVNTALLELSFLIGMTSVALAAPSASARSEIATLRSLRTENNRALASRDLAKTMAIAAEDYALVGGNDGIHRTRSEIQEYWAKAFADPQSLPCVRHPEQISIGDYGGVRRAAEIGSWSCPQRSARGEERLWGQYLAHWSKRSGAWLVVSDNYVTLGCRGTGCNTNR